MHELDRDEAWERARGYGRPTTAAWVAAVSVAFAVFILGGFIKTYRQLESIKTEAKRDIQELRDALDALRNNPSASDSAARARQQPRVAEQRPLEPPEANPASVPAASGTEERFAAGAWNAEAEDGGGRRREPLFTTASGMSSFIPADKRKPSGAAPAAAKPSEAGRIKVIAVNSGQKKIMVEGGRDLGIAEGGRLEMSRSGRWIGDLRVVAVFDNISACEVLHCTTPPEPGDLVRLPDKPAS